MTSKLIGWLVVESQVVMVVVQLVLARLAFHKLHVKKFWNKQTFIDPFFFLIL